VLLVESASLPLGPPTSATTNTRSSAIGLAYNGETTVWALSEGVLSLVWVNPDSTTTVAYPMITYGLFILLTGSPAAFISARGGGTQVVFSIFTPPPPVVASVKDDPHFIGIHGEKYSVVGEGEKWFNIISTPDFQFNAFFQQACENKKGMTAITSVAVKINGHRFRVNATGSAQLDGATLKTPPHAHSHPIGENGVYGSISHPWNNNFEIHTPEFSVVLIRHMIDPTIQKPGMVYYGKNCLVSYFNTEFKDHNMSSAMHGLLGQTAHHVHLHAVSAKGNEGQGEIEGTYKDYIVSGPYENDFKFNQYKLVD